MVEVKSFVYSESVSQTQTAQGPKPVIVSPIATIVVPNTPTLYTFGITFLLTGLDFSARHSITISFAPCSDSENSVILQKGDIPSIPKNVQDKVNVPSVLVMSTMAQNILLRTSGEYHTIIKIDDTNIPSETITVISKEGPNDGERSK